MTLIPRNKTNLIKYLIKLVDKIATYIEILLFTYNLKFQSDTPIVIMRDCFNTYHMNKNIIPFYFKQINR